MLKQILLLDDDPRFRAAVALASSEHQCTVIQTASIKEAEMEMAASRFNLLIVDGKLPDGDGLSWISSLRKKSIDTPALFISGQFRDSASFKILSNDMGACNVLQKPISVKVLSEEIQKLLEGETGAQHDYSDSFEDELAMLEVEYKKDLPSKIGSLKKLIEETERDPENIQLLRKAINQAHMLRGTAGMYGLASFGIAMARVEDMLSLMANNVMSGTAFAESWTSIIHSITDASDAVMSTLNTAAAKTRQSNDDNSTSTNRRKHVVIFDSQQTYTQRIENLLSSDGFLVFTFRDCVYAKDVITQKKPDLVIVDMESTEDITGFYHTVRGYLGNEAPMVVSTDKVDLTLRNRLLECGFSSVISKQLSNLEFLSEMKSLMRVGGAIVPAGSSSLKVA